MVESQSLFSERFNMWCSSPTPKEVVEVMDRIIFRDNPDDVGLICCVGPGDQSYRAKQAEAETDNYSQK
jgi:hypothetical protein